MKTILLILSLLALTLPAVYADPGDPAATYQGQPVGPNLSPEDAVAYFNQMLDSWFAFQLPNRSPKMDPETVLKFAGTARRLGIANLAAVFSHTAPDSEYKPDAGPFDPKDATKRLIAEKAISMAAEPSDVPALVALYDERPLILEVFADHPAWDTDEHLTDFLATEIPQIKEAYRKSDEAPIYLLELAAESKNPQVQSAFNDLLTDATTNDGDYRNAHLYIGLLEANNASPGSPIAAHLGDIYTVLAHRVKDDPSDVYNDVAPKEIFYLMTVSNPAVTNPLMFANDKIRTAMLKLSAAAQDSNFTDPSALMAAAASGSKPALVKLAEYYDGKDDSANGVQDSFFKSQAKAYLATITVLRDGDKLDQVVKHVDDCIYNPATATWTLPKDGDTSLPATTAPTPAPSASVTPTAPPAPVPAFHPVVTPVEPNVAPTVTQPAMTAIVVKPTNISTTTPSGGHAAVPLDVGTHLTVLSINPDGTITAKTDFSFQGQLPQICVSIQKP